MVENLGKWDISS